MSKKSKPQPSAPPIDQAFTDLTSPSHLHREMAIDLLSHSAADAGAIISGLLRGVNDPDEFVRIIAFKGLLRAFPDAEVELEKRLHALDLESGDPKVRLAANGQVIRILAESLAGIVGTTLNPSAPDLEQLVPTREDLMEHAGRWVAWTPDRQRVLAVSDSFSDVMEQAAILGECDPYIKKLPGVYRKALRETVELSRDESANIADDVSKVVPDAAAWLNTPNDSLGGDKPRDLIDTDREFELRYLLRGIIDGISS